MGLTPEFNEQTIVADLQKFALGQESKFIEALAYIGEQFVNEARQKRTYLDETGNLRASIGYSIIKNGKVLLFRNPGKASEGKIEAANFVNTKVAEQEQDGIYLMVYAGMEYALYVEANHLDVLSGSRPSRSEVLRTFKDLLL